MRDVAPGPAPARDTWYAEPAKVFDNLYFVGSKIHNSWALTGSEGIILIDTIYTYNSEEEIIGGLKKLGLDPAKVKYVIISHAHPDHVGGAKLMQDRYGSRIVMGGPDWDSIEKSVNGYPEGKPKNRGRETRNPSRPKRLPTRRCALSEPRGMNSKTSAPVAGVRRITLKR